MTVVYTIDRGAEEYRPYLEFITADNFLVGHVEEPEIGALQGVSGLKALRVGFNTSRKNHGDF